MASQQPEKSERPASKARRSGRDERSAFDGFVGSAYRVVSRPRFFAACVLLILLWAASVPLWADLQSWELAIHTVVSVVSLLLLALLENAGRRADEAAQEKLNVLAEALAALMDSRAAEDPRVAEEAQRLRDAVGLERRH
ncbi:MAG: low affinity iron permease family protein [Thermocrispum sp.]